MFNACKSSAVDLISVALDQTPFDVLLGHARNALNLWESSRSQRHRWGHPGRARAPRPPGL